MEEAQQEVWIHRGLSVELKIPLTGKVFDFKEGPIELPLDGTSLRCGLHLPSPEQRGGLLCTIMGGKTLFQVPLSKAPLTSAPASCPGTSLYWTGLVVFRSLDCCHRNNEMHGF